MASVRTLSKIFLLIAGLYLFFASGSRGLPFGDEGELALLRGPAEVSVSPAEVSVSPAEASVSPAEASVSPAEVLLSPARVLRNTASVLLSTADVFGAHQAMAQDAEDNAYEDELLKGHLALRALDLKAARDAVAGIPPEARLAPDIRYFLGRLAFYEGKYQEAVQYFEGINFVDSDGDEDEFPAYVRQVADATAGLTLEESEHFKLYYDASSADRILVQYAFATLEQAYQALGAELGHYPPEKVRVEIYPTSRQFIQASGLKASEIETTGTVALCIYNKLMITTPRALAQGYRWMDTLSHEYIHLLVAQRSRNTVPVWLQEGLAKFFEVRWRGGRGADMTQTSESLLAEALEAGKLVPFEKMSPSLAKLPSAEEAQLAFAQVQTVIEFIIQRRGLEGIHQLMDEMAEGKSDRAAVANVVGMPFSEFETQWKVFIAKKQLKVVPRLAVLPTILKAQEVAEGKVVEDDKVADPFMAEYKTLREFSRLGDLLRARGRFKAALIEYQKAKDSVDVESPALSVKIALTHLQGNHPDEAIRVLEQTVEAYPSFAPAFTTLGTAQLAMGDDSSALDSFRTANAINPFDPRLHRDLAVLYQARGEKEPAQHEEKVLLTLLGRG